MLATRLPRYVGPVIVCLAAAGCGKQGLVPLRGVVTLDGRPLANATVHFIAQVPGGRDALGSTNAKGVFRLSTYEPDDGAFPGKYKVIVRPVAEADPEFAAATPAEAMQMVRTDRKPRRPQLTLPPRYSQPGQTILVQDVPAKGNVIFELQSQ